MKSWERWIVYILLFIVLILSIVSICRTLPRTDLGFDYLGVIVGILSLLVTALIGWNIYTTIDVKSQVKSIKNITDKAQEETKARAYTSLMNQTSYIVEGRKENDDCYNAISNGLFACKHYHLAGKTKDRDELLSIISNFKIENSTLNHKQINDLRIILGQLKSYDIDITQIENWLNSYEEAKQT